MNLETGYTVFSVGDVNSDGRSDIIANDSSLIPKAVTVWYGNATRRSFPNHTTIDVGGCLSQAPVTVADLDGNGYNDLIATETTCSNSTTEPVYLKAITRNANASYNPAQTLYSVPSATSGVNQIGAPLVLHADHNAKPDLLFAQCLGQYCANGSSTITLLNNTAGAFHICDPSTAEGISVCLPVATTSLTSPVTFNVGAAPPTIARDINVWIDGKKVAEQIDGFSNYTYLTKSVSVTPGRHTVSIYAAGWDQSTVRKSLEISVH